MHVNVVSINVWFYSLPLSSHHNPPLPNVSGESPIQPLPPFYHDPNAPGHCGGLGMCLLQQDQLEWEEQHAAGAGKKDALKGWLTWGAAAHCVIEGQIKRRAPLVFHHISFFFFFISSTVNGCSLIESKKKNQKPETDPLLVTMNNDIRHNTTFLFKWPMRAQSTKKQGQHCPSRLTADLWEVHGRDTTLLSMSRYGLPPVAHKTQNFHRETTLRTWSVSIKLPQ